MSKFETLVHNGVLFPKPFEGFPKEVKNKTAFLKSLSPLGEEMFWNYSAKRDTDYVKDKVFNKNFFKNFKEEIGEEYRKLNFPEDFKKDIDIVFDWNEIRKQLKKQYNKEHKEEIEKEKAAIKEKYGKILIDGKEQPLGISQIEPGSIFIGRGKCPIRGYWKYQAQPEDVAINYIGPKETEPQPPEGHKWREVVHNNNMCCIGVYPIDIGHTGELKWKCLRFGGGSDIQIENDQHKFDKALKLVQNWDKVQKYISDGLKSNDKKTRECAAIAWLIQNTAIRVGNERGEFESQEVVGASTLKVENIKVN